MSSSLTYGLLKSLIFVSTTVRDESHLEEYHPEGAVNRLRAGHLATKERIIKNLKQELDKVDRYKQADNVGINNYLKAVFTIHSTLVLANRSTNLKKLKAQFKSY